MAHNPLPPAFNSTASTKTNNLTLQSTIYGSRGLGKASQPPHQPSPSQPCWMPGEEMARDWPLSRTAAKPKASLEQGGETLHMLGGETLNDSFLTSAMIKF